MNNYQVFNLFVGSAVRIFPIPIYTELNLFLVFLIPCILTFPYLDPNSYQAPDAFSSYASVGDRCQRLYVFRLSVRSH